MVSMLKLSHLKRSAVISAVFGTVLTVTNQYEAVMAERSLNLLKALITYAIPFCVSLTSTFKIYFIYLLSLRVPSFKIYMDAVDLECFLEGGIKMKMCFY